MSFSAKFRSIAPLTASDNAIPSPVFLNTYVMVLVRHPLSGFNSSPVCIRSLSVISMGNALPTLLSYCHSIELARCACWMAWYRPIVPAAAFFPGEIMLTPNDIHLL